VTGTSLRTIQFLPTYLFNRGQLSQGWMTGVRLPTGAGIFLLSTASKMTLGQIELPTQWLRGGGSIPEGKAAGE